MKFLSTLLLSALLCIAQTNSAVAQHKADEHNSEEAEHSHEHESHEHATHGKNKISIYTGFTHIPDAFYHHETHEESTGKWVPTLGLDYWRTLNNRWDLGALFDMELDEYFITETHEDEADRVLERNNVVILAAVAKYKPCHGLGIFVGPGIEWEFAKETKEFFVVKCGIEYEIEIDKGWEITPSFIYDFKEEYSAYSYGFSIGKRF